MDSIFQEKENEEGSKTIYVSVDHIHGRLYYLMLKEQIAPRLPYRFIYSPHFELADTLRQRKKLVSQMRKSMKETDMYMLLHSYDANRTIPECKPFRELNWQNLELREIRKRGAPILQIRLQVGLDPLEQMPSDGCIIANEMDLENIERIIREGLRYT